MKPVSPLPWKIVLDESVCAADDTTIAYDLNFSEDADYLIHACNAYPKLVECLKQFAGGWEGRRAENLLKELGEL
jgi:hypothetical protein